MVVMRRTLFIVIALVLASAPALAGSAQDPEIQDDQGDVRAQYIVDTGELDTSELTPEEASRLGDVLSAWVHQETDESFQITVQLGDIPDDENLSAPLAEVWAHFEIKSDTYHAVAKLSAPTGEDRVQARYELIRGSTVLTELAGSVDTEADQVTFRIAKADVREPGFGDELERFYITTHLPDRGPVLDYAPRAEPMTIEEANLDPLNPTLGPTVSYGSNYAFGDHEGAVSSQIEVQLTPSSLQVTSGEQGEFGVTVRNDAQVTDTVSLTLGDVPPGWNARLQDTTLSLEPGQARITTLYITSPSDASGQSLLTLHASSSLGADQQAVASLAATQPPSQDGGTDQATGGQDGDDGGGQAPGSQQPAPGSQQADEDAAEEETEASNDSPAPTVWLVTSVIAGLALVIGRRRRG